MTCYTRHLKDLFEEARVEYTVENKHRADGLFKKMTGRANCPEAWKFVKASLQDPQRRKELLKALRGL